MVLHSLHRSVVLLIECPCRKLPVRRLAAILGLAIERTILGVIEGALSRMNRTLASNAGVTLELDGDPSWIALVTTHRSSPLAPACQRPGRIWLGLENPAPSSAAALLTQIWKGDGGKRIRCEALRSLQ